MNPLGRLLVGACVLAAAVTYQFVGYRLRKFSN
jgi:hypothetical protein